MSTLPSGFRLPLGGIDGRNAGASGLDRVPTFLIIILAALWLRGSSHIAQGHYPHRVTNARINRVVLVGQRNAGQLAG